MAVAAELFRFRSWNWLPRWLSHIWSHLLVLQAPSHRTILNKLYRLTRCIQRLEADWAIFNQINSIIGLWEDLAPVGFVIRHREPRFNWKCSSLRTVKSFVQEGEGGDSVSPHVKIASVQAWQTEEEQSKGTRHPFAQRMAVLLLIFKLYTYKCDILHNTRLRNWNGIIFNLIFRERKILGKPSW